MRSDNNYHRAPQRNSSVTFDVILKFMSEVKAALRELESQYCELETKSFADVKVLRGQLEELSVKSNLLRGQLDDLLMKNESMKAKMKMMGDNMARYEDADRVIQKHEQECQQLRITNQSMNTRAVRACLAAGGDVGSFIRDFNGKTLTSYPDADTIVLHREDPEVKNYDFMGCTPFSADQPECHFRVVTKGWRDNETVWVEARVSPLCVHQE